MWDLILNPFVTLLTWLYSVLNHDIVLSIVILTVIIRFLTYPLLATQQKSSKKMQQLQPKLKKLQEKYKDDREKLSQAQMELYREHGVNPFGGCLPLLIQFPILIGLYQAINFALASTPFQLVDLSERLLIPGLDGLIPLQNTWLGMNLAQAPSPPLNPTYALALPLLVMGTTYLQSRFSMAQAAPPPAPSKDGKQDPADQATAMTRQMTTVMPIMFGFFALSFPVGLSIYFIVSNIVGIIQYSPQGKKVLGRLFGGHDDEPDEISADDEDAVIEVSASENGKDSGEAKPVKKEKPGVMTTPSTRKTTTKKKKRRK